MILRFFNHSFLFSLMIMLGCLSETWATGPSWDLNAEGIFRSFPFGGYVKTIGGKSLAIWGNPSKENRNILYGFSRLGATARTSGIINSIEGDLSFYPISFLGIYASSGKTFRNSSKLDTFNCDVLQCKGTVTKNAFGAKTALAFKGVFAMLDYKQTAMEITDSQRFFADEVSTLEGNIPKDRLQSLVAILGYKFNEDFRIGLLDLSHSMKNTSQKTRMDLVLFQQNFANLWTGSLGLGQFKTRYDQKVFTSIIQVKWNIEKGFLLF